MRNAYTATFIVLSTISGLIGMLYSHYPSSPSIPVKTASAAIPQIQPPILKSPDSTFPGTPAYVRPKVADNGSPFPSQSGYIAKYPQKFTDGYSSVTVDNSKNDSDLFIKLFSVDVQPPIPVSVFLVRGKDSFTVKEVRAGKYEARYQDLQSGTLSRTDSFTLKEIDVLGGVEFSKLTLILHKVSNGNLKSYPISAAEFNK